jgi:hypothetical protein
MSEKSSAAAIAVIGVSFKSIKHTFPFLQGKAAPVSRRWKYRAMFPSCSGLWWREKEGGYGGLFFSFHHKPPLTLNLELMNQKKNTPIGTVK